MAGIMNKLQGYVYNGEMTNGLTAPVENGVLLVANGNKLVAPAADTTSKLVCVDKTELHGTVAYRFRVEKLNATYYFVENQLDYNDSDAYDTATYTTAAGELLRAHPLLVGEEFTTTKVTGAPVAGTAYGVKADGTVG